MIQYRCMDNDSGFISGHIYDLDDINNLIKIAQDIIQTDIDENI